MLYDKRWDDKVAYGISLRGLIAWLEKQDPKQRYEYTDPYRCVLGQYLQSFGLSEQDSFVDFGNRPDKTGPQAWLHFIAYGYGPDTDPNSRPEQTFGAALERSRRVLTPN